MNWTNVSTQSLFKIHGRQQCTQSEHRLLQAMAVDIPADRSRRPSTSELSSSSSPNPKPVSNPQNEVLTAARIISDQALPSHEPGVWAVLTAISKNARLRPQGVNMLLTEDEHCIGRCVDDRFQIKAISISANHCKIYREREASFDGGEGSSSHFKAFLRDTSTNGTFLNWVKLRKGSKAVLTHGDIVSFASPPLDDKCYAFVYREVPGANTDSLKRKSENFGSESKRLKGIGIGALEGPVSLDDVRNLQRSNNELRQQLESHVLTIEALHNENRNTNAQHENELKEQKETISDSYYNQIKDLRNLIDAKQRAIDDLYATSSEQHNFIKDLDEKLNSSMQSRTDAGEIINSQRATILELETQLNEERNTKREEREKAELDLKLALQKAHIESQEEIKRQVDVYLKQNREQQELIIKLQDSEKESRLLVEMLRSKLEDARESIVTSEKKARQLEAQLQDELMASTNNKKKMDTVEAELKILKKELENEKVAREEAWAKVSSLELEIAAAIRDLSKEKQRFQGARERIILRETQLRSFYSTTEDISALFAKQQEQLKAMQKTLEDEENYENSLFAADLNNIPKNAAFFLKENHNESSGTRNYQPNIAGKDDSDGEDDACTTQKHEPHNYSQDANTQDLAGDKLARGFRFDIDPIGTEIIPDLSNGSDTQRVLGTETQIGDRSGTLLKCSNLDGNTMQIDDEAEVQDGHERLACNSDLKTSSMSSPLKKDDIVASTIRTADLLASEVAGSWAVDTAPSIYGENESPEANADGAETDVACQMLGYDAHAEGSQSNSAPGVLSTMINLVEPIESPSDAETEEGSNHGDACEKNENDTEDDGANEIDVMIEDSIG